MLFWYGAKCLTLRWKRIIFNSQPAHYQTVFPSNHCVIKKSYIFTVLTMLQFKYKMHACLKVQHSETFQINTFDFKEGERSEIKACIDTLKLKPKHREPFYWKSSAEWCWNTQTQMSSWTWNVTGHQRAWNLVIIELICFDISTYR